ncbi:MAG: hypothetical protein D6712_17775 [Chloroflexi bacterium]|nr:MAG: hypothetical protein D6712_17775 [Chloroflexota bacterium]
MKWLTLIFTFLSLEEIAKAFIAWMRKIVASTENTLDDQAVDIVVAILIEAKILPQDFDLDRRLGTPPSGK